jgi:hypothetical protein
MWIVWTSVGALVVLAVYCGAKIRAEKVVKEMVEE